MEDTRGQKRMKTEPQGAQNAHQLLTSLPSEPKQKISAFSAAPKDTKSVRGSGVFSGKSILDQDNNSNSGLGKPEQKEEKKLGVFSSNFGQTQANFLKNFVQKSEVNPASDPASEEAWKEGSEEPKTENKGLFNQPTGGLFGANKPTQGGLFNKAPASETKTGLFASVSQSGLDAKTETKPSTGFSGTQEKKEEGQGTAAFTGLFAKPTGNTPTAQETKPATMKSSGLFGQNLPPIQEKKDETTPTAAKQDTKAPQTQGKTLFGAGAGSTPTSTQGGLFSSATQKTLEEKSSTEPKVGGLFGQKPATTTTTGQESKPEAKVGSLFGATFTATQEKKEESKGLTPSTGLFGKPATTTPTNAQESKPETKPGGLFGASSTTTTTATTQEKKEEAAPTLINSVPTTTTAQPTSQPLFGAGGSASTGGLFGAKTGAQESKTEAAPGGLFGKAVAANTNPMLSKPATETKPGGLFGQQSKPTSEAEKDVKPAEIQGLGQTGVFGKPTQTQSQTNVFGSGPQTQGKGVFGSSSGQENKPGMLGSSTTGAGVQVQAQGHSKPLFGSSIGQTEAKPKEAAPAMKKAEQKDVSSARVIHEDYENTYVEALKKEDQVVEKIEGLVNKITKNVADSDHYLEEKSQIIDTFFQDFENTLIENISNQLRDCKRKLYAKIEAEVEDYQAVNHDIKSSFRSMVLNDCLIKHLDEGLGINSNPEDEDLASEPAEKTELKKYLTNSHELKSGITPLVKKYKLIKYTIPNLDSAFEALPSMLLRQESLAEYSKIITRKIETSIKEFGSLVEGNVNHLARDLKPFKSAIENIRDLKGSVLPLDSPLYPKEKQKSKPEGADIQEVKYELRPEELSALKNVLGDEKVGKDLAFRLKDVTVPNEVDVGDLVFYESAPYEIASKTAASGGVKVSLKKLLTGEAEKGETDWGDKSVQKAIVAGRFVVTKPEKKGYYTVMNLEDEDSTNSQLKVVRAGNVASGAVRQRLNDILRECGRAVVRIVRVKDEDVVVSCQKLKFDKEKEGL